MSDEEHARLRTALLQDRAAVELHLLSRRLHSRLLRFALWQPQPAERQPPTVPELLAADATVVAVRVAALKAEVPREVVLLAAAAYEAAGALFVSTVLVVGRVHGCFAGMLLRGRGHRCARLAMLEMLLWSSLPSMSGATACREAELAVYNERILSETSDGRSVTVSQQTPMQGSRAGTPPRSRRRAKRLRRR